MCSYHNTDPRFPNGHPRPPLQPGFQPKSLLTGQNSPDQAGQHAELCLTSPGIDTHDANTQDDDTPGANTQSVHARGVDRRGHTPNNLSPIGSGPGGPSQRPASRAKSPGGEPPDVISSQREYRNGPVYGGMVSTSVLKTMGFVTHMDTLRFETPALGLMVYLDHVARQHHGLLRHKARTSSQQGDAATPHTATPNATPPQTVPAGALPPSGDGALHPLASSPSSSSDSSSSNQPSSFQDAPAPSSSYQYVNIYSGREHIVEREAGTFVKSAQGIAEDLYQRICKRLPPAQDPLSDSRFRQFYDRIHQAIKRYRNAGDVGEISNVNRVDDTDADHTGHTAPLTCLGPVIPSANKLVRDRNGRRWALHTALQSDTAQTTRAVRSAGPEPIIPWHRRELDPLQVAEALYAHRKTLYKDFTVGWKATIQNGQWTSPVPRVGQRSARYIAKHGSDVPSFLSLGRWRSGEIKRRNPDSAITVPWIVADIDGPDRFTSHQHAQTLCRLLAKCGLDPSEIVVSYTGGKGFHVRIPHGAVGCPIYQDKNAVHTLISGFFDRLCENHPQLRKAIDNMACRATQPIRMIGSTRGNGQRCIGLSGKEFLNLPPLVVFGHSECGHYTAFELPKPRNASYVPALTSLLLHEESSTATHPVSQRVTNLLQPSFPSVTVTLKSNPQSKKRPNSPRIPTSVIDYCWKPYFSRPPPLRDLGADPGAEESLAQLLCLDSPANRTEYASHGLIDRLMEPVGEAEPWGNAADRPYVGRNSACFVMGLYATTYPNAALRRVLRLLQARKDAPVPVGDGMPLPMPVYSGESMGNRWTRQLTGALPKSDETAVHVPVRVVVQAWNRLICSPALPEREVDKTLRSARLYAEDAQQ